MRISIVWPQAEADSKGGDSFVQIAVVKGCTAALKVCIRLRFRIGRLLFPFARLAFDKRFINLVNVRIVWIKFVSTADLP